MRKKKEIIPPVDSPIWKNQTAFRITERRCKRKGDFDNSLLFECCGENTMETQINLFGQTLTAIQFNEFPGMMLIRNAIPTEMQIEIVKEALEEWAKPPNVCNLDLHFHLDKIGIWNRYRDWKEDGSQSVEPLIRKRHFEQLDIQVSLSNTNCNQAETSCTSKENMCNASFANSNKDTEFVVDKETNLKVDKPVDTMLDKSDAPISAVLPRMRWLTLGHQYDWTKKEYHFDRAPPFPTSLKKISLDIVKSIEGITGYHHTRWNPEAGIVNFYQPGDSLTAHQDRSEINTEAPLLSLSIGLECIFLFGTTDRNDTPITLKLNSGDLIIMFGEGRRSFHGVPRVFPNTSPEFLKSIDPLFGDYLTHTRININIRQVY